jgi:hypothetical protein
MRRTPDRQHMTGRTPPPLRVASFVTASLGGLLVGLGSLLAWASVHLDIQGLTGNTLSSTVQGVDTPEGKVALVLGFVLLVGGVAMRGMASKSLARAVGWIVIVAGIGAVGIGVADIVRGVSAFDQGTEAFLEAITRRIASNSGLPLKDLLAKAPHPVVDLHIWLYLVIAGGVLGIIGGLLGLVWVGRASGVEPIADTPLPSGTSTPLPPPDPGAPAPPEPGSQLPPG